MPLLEQVLERYPNDVKLVYKNFPLRNHKFAQPAAIAALAAHEQGKFWEFHDKLFANFSQLNDQKIDDIALQLGLDMDRYNQDKKDSKLLMTINRDLQDGARVGVRGTPTIFVNGRLLQQRSMQGFQNVIDKELVKIRRVKSE